MQQNKLSLEGVQVLGALDGEFSEILNQETQKFLAALHRSFNATRLELLKQREVRQAEIDQGKVLSFLPQTKAIREDPGWRGADPAPGLVDRRVEITGPVDRKMVINALNSGATQFMADFEDSNAPTWSNNLNGQINLRDAIHRTIKFTAPNGKFYKLNDSVAVLLVRPRGWHLPEKHFVVDGQPISGALFDFGVYFFHNAHKAIEIGHGPYFYLPKMESHLEARCFAPNCRLWNDVFNFAQDYLGIKRGTIRATCLIETITAAFEMEEIIYELRQHSAGLNCGRWDYIFSCIKKFRAHKRCVLPDRSQVTMTVPFMDAYVKLLIATCHKRGVHAMGGMAAQIPIKSDPAANELAMEKVRKDKTREVTAGHDGTWVAHPDLVRLAKEIFDRHMPQPNQLHLRPHGYEQGADRLIDFSIPGSYISEAGIKDNISAALQYIESWLCGNGCVPINHLMEDAATAEIARCQIWQWIHHGAVTKEGRKIDENLVQSLLESQMAIFQTQLGDKFGKSKFELAKQIFIKVSMKQPLEEFLTTACYDYISGSHAASSKL